MMDTADAWFHARDAELEQARETRLPPQDHEAAIFFTLETTSEGPERPYVEAFERGYRWGEDAQAFLVSDDTIRSVLSELAERILDYYERLSALEASGVDASLAEPVVGKYVGEAVALAAGHGTLILNAETSSHGSVKAAYEAECAGLDLTKRDGSPPVEKFVEQAFHLGAFARAFQTALFMELPFQARVRRVAREGAQVASESKGRMRRFGFRRR